MEDGKNKPEAGSVEIGDAAFHYCVLYTRALKQWMVTKALKKALPAARGPVFYPCVELWRHDLKDTEFKPLFPGYVFVRSDMKSDELHEFVREHRRDVVSSISKNWA